MRFEGHPAPAEISNPILEETYVDATLGGPQGNGPELKVLGVLWNPHQDYLKLDISAVVSAALTLDPTKRNMVSVIGRFYDPIGYLAPVVIPFKILFQELCSEKVGWDESFLNLC